MFQEGSKAVTDSIGLPDSDLKFSIQSFILSENASKVIAADFYLQFVRRSSHRHNVYVTASFDVRFTLPQVLTSGLRKKKKKKMLRFRQ